MKFRLLIKHEGQPDEAAWDEVYDKEELKTPEEVAKYAAEIVSNFNETLIPGEKRRELVRIEDVEESDLVLEDEDEENDEDESGA